MLQNKLATEKMVATDRIDEVREILESDFKTSYFTTSLKDIEIHEDGTVTAENRSWPCTEGFMESLAKRIHMPMPYAYHIGFDLFKHNFDQRKTIDGTGVKICISRGYAVNVCKGTYYPARTIDVIETLPEKFGTFRFNEAVITDSFIELSWCDETIQINPRPNDTILGGLKITNSETGFRGLMASLFTLRKICVNGAIFSNETQIARWSYDRRMTYTRNIENFCKKLDLLEIPQAELAEKYASVADGHLSDRQAVNLWRRIRRYLAPDTTDMVLGMNNSLRQDLFEQVRLYDDPYMAQPTELNTYDVHNRITAGAKTLPPIRRTRLEEIGGSLVWN